jgi:hypothetical protein
VCPTPREHSGEENWQTDREQDFHHLVSSNNKLYFGTTDPDFVSVVRRAKEYLQKYANAVDEENLSTMNDCSFQTNRRISPLKTNGPMLVVDCVVADVVTSKERK